MHEERPRRIWAVVVAVVIFIIIIASVVIVLMNSQATPTLEVSDVSLNPNEIYLNTSATLTFSIKNNDALKPHTVTVVFNTSSVTFYQNNVSLPLGGNGLQYLLGLQYLIVFLQPSEKSTFLLKVTGTLAGGASKSSYAICIEFYDSTKSGYILTNSTKFDSETESLTVNSG